MSRLSYKTLFIILLFLLIPFVFLLKINQKSTKTLAAWWNNSWAYRVPINIGNSAAPQSNIQIKIIDNNDLTTLITAGKIQTSLNDIRFTDINGELIDYWIEDSTNNSVDIWGIIPSLPAGNSTIYMYYGNSSAPSVSNASNMTIGGTMTYVNGYRIHTFKSSGTLINTKNTNVEILIVAGGGGGAAMTGGGGGAGGLVYNSSFPITAQTYNVTVGLGGSGQIGTDNPGNGSDGQNSSFDNLTAIGGGGAGTNSGIGRSGGSGGGAGHNNTTGGIGTSGQGNNGSGGNTAAPNYGAGGGGGAGSAGGTPTNYSGGDGGIGIAYSISGTNEYYAGGGGGGTYMGGTLGLGGSGGGGNAPAGNAIPNTGGGGGGQINNQANAGNGASGIVILRYPSATTNPPTIEEIRPQGINIRGNGNETHPGNLIAYYKFDEGQGTIAHNSSSTASTLDGTISSATWTNGKNNKALNFISSSTSRVQTPITSTNGLDIKGALSYSVWFKRNSATDYQTLIDMEDNCTAIETDGYYLRFHDTNLYFFGQINNTTGTDPFTLMYSDPVLFSDTTNWHHASVTWDGTTNTNGVKMYIDGKLVAQTTAAATATLMPSLNGNNLTIGTLSCNSHAFNGLIDDVKIYNFALSADEIKSDYNQASSVAFGVTNLTVGNTSNSTLYCVPASSDPCSPPVGEWNFEEGLGTTAYDTSSNNNNGIFGTGSSAPTWTIGKIGKGLTFNGSNNYVSVGTTLSSLKSISFWIKPSTASQYFLDFDNGTHYLYSSLNKIYAIGFTSPNIYVNGIGTTAISQNIWQHITITTNTAFNATTLTFGKSTTNYFTGSLDQIRIYNYARTPAQIAWDYNQGAPIGWWKFDECQGSIVHDSSGIGNTGSIIVGTSGTQTSVGSCTTSGAWYNGATGKFNSSLNFDGSNDYITFTTSLFQQLKGSPGSLSFWINSSAYSDYHVIYEAGLSVNNFAAKWPSTSSDTFDFNIGSNTAIASTKKDFQLNTWYHVVITWNATNSINIYFDGKLNRTLTSSNSPGNANNYTQFGRYLLQDGRSGAYFKGLLDDIRIYSYALNSDQIKQVYNNGAINFN